MSGAKDYTRQAQNRYEMNMSSASGGTRRTNYH
jgi:hypothetical protein